MSLVTQQLERLNEEKRNLEKRIEEEKKKKIKLKKQSIRYLEELIKPLTNRLDVTGTVVLTNNNRTERIYFEDGKDIKKSFRDTQTEIYNDDLKSFKTRKQQIEERINKMQDKRNYVFIPPRKAKPLVEEEIYTTIIGILKKQEQEIQDLKQQLNQK